MRRILFIICLICALDSVSVAETLKVGAVLGFSGAAQKWADNARKAIELALAEVNPELHKSGKEIQVIFEDSRSVPASAVTAYRKLVDKDKVSVVIGDVWAFLTIPLLSLSERDKVILISPTVQDESFPERTPYFFSFGHSFSGMRPAAQLFFERHPNLRKIGMIYFDDYWNNAFVRLVATVAQNRTVVIDPIIPLNEFFPDLRNEAVTLRRSSVDAVVVTWRAEVLLQRLLEQKFSVPLLTSSDVVEAVLGRAGSADLLEGVYFLDWQASAEFESSFKKKFGHAPLFEAHNSYEIIRSLAKALRGQHADLRENLKTIKYQGAGDFIDFTKGPFVNQGRGSLFRVRQGNFEIVTR